MKLSDKDIRYELEEGELEVYPLDLEEQLQPCSLDIRLGDECLEYITTSNEVIDVKDTDISTKVRRSEIWEDDGLLIGPDDFFLVDTMEWVEIPDDLMAHVEGRSSIGRLSIEIHSTAGVVDPGFEGQITLEISNNSNHHVRVYPGMRIGQLTFEPLSSPVEEAYGEKENSKYDSQQGAVESRIGEDFE